MDEKPSIEAQLALFAVGEALRARAEAMAAWHFLKGAGVPKEVLDQTYLMALRVVTEEAREGMKAAGVPELVANGITDKLISSLPTEEESEAGSTVAPN